MAWVVSGRLNKQTAGELCIAEITVKVHRRSVMRKMQARSLPDLVLMAAMLRFLSVPGDSTTRWFIGLRCFSGFHRSKQARHHRAITAPCAIGPRRGLSRPSINKQCLVDTLVHESCIGTSGLVALSRRLPEERFVFVNRVLMSSKAVGVEVGTHCTEGTLPRPGGSCELSCCRLGLASIRLCIIMAMTNPGKYLAPPTFAFITSPPDLSRTASAVNSELARYQRTQSPPVVGCTSRTGRARRGRARRTAR